MRKLPFFRPDRSTRLIAARLHQETDRVAWNGQTLGQLSLQNLLPCPLALVPRVNRFAVGLKLPIVDFKVPPKSLHFSTESTTDNSAFATDGTTESMKQQLIDIPWTMSNRPVRPDIFHRAVVWHRANQRKGLASTKNRGRVSGGGRKIYRQKGTGKARAGSSRAPQRRGGGVVFGPRPRDFSQKLPNKIRQMSVMSALAMKVKLGQLVVVDGTSINMDTHKTGQLARLLNKYAELQLGVEVVRRRRKQGKPIKMAIVDTLPFERNISLAAQMLSDRLKLISLQDEKELKCYDLLNCNTVFMTDRTIGHLASLSSK